MILFTANIHKADTNINNVYFMYPIVHVSFNALSDSYTKISLNI